MLRVNTFILCVRYLLRIKFCNYVKCGDDEAQMLKIHIQIILIYCIVNMVAQQCHYVSLSPWTYHLSIHTCTRSNMICDCMSCRCPYTFYKRSCWTRSSVWRAHDTDTHQSCMRIHSKLPQRISPFTWKDNHGYCGWHLYCEPKHTDHCQSEYMAYYTVEFYD